MIGDFFPGPMKKDKETLRLFTLYLMMSRNLTTYSPMINRNASFTNSISFNH